AMISPPRMAARESFSLRTRAGAIAALSSATRWRLGTSFATLRRAAGRGLAMGVSTNISLPTKISHAGFRTKTVDFIQLNPVLPPPVMPGFEPHPAKSRSHTLEPLAKTGQAIGNAANPPRPSPDLSPQGILRLGR